MLLKITVYSNQFLLYRVSISKTMAMTYMSNGNAYGSCDSNLTNIFQSEETLKNPYQYLDENANNCDLFIKKKRGTKKTCSEKYLAQNIDGASTDLISEDVGFCASKVSLNKKHSTDNKCAIKHEVAIGETRPKARKLEQLIIAPSTVTNSPNFNKNKFEIVTGASYKRAVSVHGADITIPARAGHLVDTDIILPNKLDKDYYQHIKPAYDDWLYNDMAQILTVKEGIVKPGTMNRLKVMIYNKTDKPLKITIGSTIASLSTQKYEYCSNLFNN